MYPEVGDNKQRRRWGEELPFYHHKGRLCNGPLVVVLHEQFAVVGEQVIHLGPDRIVFGLSGEFMGIPPTGRRQEVDEVYFLRVENGKFVEFWGLEDNLTRMRQLGLIPEPYR